MDLVASLHTLLCEQIRPESIDSFRTLIIDYADQIFEQVCEDSSCSVSSKQRREMIAQNVREIAENINTKADFKRLRRSVRKLFAEMLDPVEDFEMETELSIRPIKSHSSETISISSRSTLPTANRFSTVQMRSIHPDSLSESKQKEGTFDEEL